MKFNELVLAFDRLEATTKRLEMFEILSNLLKRAGPAEIDKIIYLSQGELLPAFHSVDLGMSEKLLIRALAAVTDRSVETVEASYQQLGDMGKTAEDLLSATAEIRGQHGHGLDVTTVYDRIMALAEEGGEGSVEKKVTSLADLFSHVQPTEAKYVARFVVGKLRLGVGDAAVLEALALSHGSRAYRPEFERAYNLCSDLGLVARTLREKGEEGVRKIHARVGYPIRMALCERMTSGAAIAVKIGRCGIEKKYDGLRCQIHKDPRGVEIFSRNLERMTPMFPEIAKAVESSLMFQNGIVEGEALAYNEATGQLLPFQITTQRRRKHRIEEISKEYPMRLFLFDILFADGEDLTGHPYSERRKRMVGVIKKNPVIEACPAVETDDPKEIERFFEEAVEEGLEGVIAKRLDAPYAAGARNFNWIKLKRSARGELTDTLDLCIVGYFKGRGHRARFGIGAVLGAAYDQETETFKSVSKVGSGFSEEEWPDLRARLDKIAAKEQPASVDSLIVPDVWVAPKIVVTVAADEITRSPMHTCGKMGEEPGYALRFPRAQTLRADKGPRDATTVKEVLTLYRAQRHVKLA